MTHNLRPYTPADSGALAQIFYDAIHTGAAAHYTQAQRTAWAAEVPTPEAWAKRLTGLWTFVAHGPGGPIGFFSLRPDGYLDLAFVAPLAMGQGAGAALLMATESRAKTTGLTRLTTEASLAAHGFFLRHGWSEIAPQTVERHGVKLRNFRMEKPITAS